MDYNYFQLENQIKALMNKNFVSQRVVSQIALQLQVENYQLFMNTTDKQLIFKYHSVHNPKTIN